MLLMATASILYFRSVFQPVLTGVALLILAALSGFLPLSILLSTDFALTTATSNPTMSTVILGISLAAPCVALAAVKRTGKKILILVSTAAMTAAALFLALLSHFQESYDIATSHVKGIHSCDARKAH